MSEEIRKAIQEGQAVLGLEFGSTRIKAVLVDKSHQPVAQGNWDWENRLEDNIWTYSLEDVWEGLRGCYRDLAQDVEARYGVPLTRPAARAVFCMGRIRDEEEEGLGDVGSSSNRLKWSRDSWELHS